MTANDTAVRTQSIVDRVKGILLKPKEEWPIIADEKTGIASLLLSYVAILAAIPVIAQLIGSLVFGYSFLGVTYRPPIAAAVGGAVGQYVLSLAAVVVIALVIDALAPTFGGRKDRVLAFKVAAYGSTAAWLAGAAALIPAIGFLAILGAYSLYLLYLGLPLLMKAPKEKALGYTAVVVIVAGVLFMVVGAVTRPLGAMIGGGSPSALTVNSTLKDRKLSLPGVGEVNLGEMERAAARAEKMSRGLQDGTTVVVPAEQLAGFLPETIGRFRRTSIESSTVGAAEMGGSHAEARYEAGEQYFELSIIDLPLVGPMAAMGAAMRVQSERRTDTGYERTHVVNGDFVTEEWDGASKRGSYSIVVGERFSVTASGRVSGMNDLTAAIAATRPARIAALAR